MSADHALTLIRQLLGVTILVAGPLLAASLIAGVLVGIVQTATQINEASIGFAVKTSFVLLVLLLAGPAISQAVIGYTRGMFESVAQVVL
jgi:flagellar biosynthetic protein FliQ